MCGRFRFCERAGHSLIAWNEMWSWLVHYFVVVILHRVNIGDDDWRRCVHRRSRRKDDAGNNRDGVAL
jgi:hypothetical protein